MGCCVGGVYVRFEGAGSRGFGVWAAVIWGGAVLGCSGELFEGSGSGVGEVVAVPAAHVFPGSLMVGD